MLTRILLAGDDGAFLKDARQAAGKNAVEFTSLAPGEALPPGTAAIITGKDGIAAAIGAALALGREQDTLIRLLADAIDCREAIPQGASERVRDHAERFAKTLKLSEADQLTLERGALVRDIGKLRISNDVLLKKNVLTYDEFTLLQLHTSLGATLLEEAGIFSDTLEIVKHHHECYDGTGYPDRLEKEEIPLSARIMKLLDVYCAMTSPRAYRDTQATQEQAIEHLKEERGKHFDPDLVDAFIKGKVGRPMESTS